MHDRLPTWELLLQHSETSGYPPVPRAAHARCRFFFFRAFFLLYSRHTRENDVVASKTTTSFPRQLIKRQSRKCWAGDVRSQSDFFGRRPSAWVMSNMDERRDIIIISRNLYVFFWFIQVEWNFSVGQKKKVFYWRISESRQIYLLRNHAIYFFPISKSLIRFYTQYI